MLDLDWLISVDDHVIEPANVWQDRVPAKFKDLAPRLVSDDDMDYWEFNGRRAPTSGLSVAAGRKKEEFSPLPMSYRDMRDGCYDSQARLEDMNRAGVLASLCFPSFPRFCGQAFSEIDDAELGMVCIRAYNDWMIEEWCGSAPGRYIPLVIIPLRDPAAAAVEMARCSAMGAHVFAFSENCEPLGLPTIHDKDGYWDPVMQAANDNEMVVCMHVGSSSTLPRIAHDTPTLANLAWGAVRTAGAMLDWLFCDYFDRMPDLKIALSEGNIGWIPYFLERAEQVVDKQRHWVTRGVGFAAYDGQMAGQKSSLDNFDVRARFRDHVFGCFIDDVHGIANLATIGEDNVMIETDYPHTDSTWPECIDLAHKRLAHLPPEVQYKILRGNAERLFHFEAAQPPTAH